MITDADIERARKGQPAVTDQDIEAARRKHNATVQVPAPQTGTSSQAPRGPSIDALPQPATRTPIDLEALAIAALVVGLVCLSLGFLVSAQVFEIEGSTVLVWMFPALSLTYLLARIRAQRHYR